MLGARLQRKSDRSFLETAQQRMLDRRALLEEAANSLQTPMKPGRVARELGARLDANAIVTWDSGHNTGLLARYIDAQEEQIFTGSGLMASMACAVPYAIAAALAHPGRQVVAFVGDGGLSMSLGELATIVRYRLPIKIIVIKNNTLGQIKWEQNVPGQSRIRVRSAAHRFCGRGRGLWHPGIQSGCGRAVRQRARGGVATTRSGAGGGHRRCQ
jgi:thiamine pyrophosphate-dependent acetolactate synthase large subunit-like protein